MQTCNMDERTNEEILRGQLENLMDKVECALDAYYANDTIEPQQVVDNMESLEDEMRKLRGHR